MPDLQEAQETAGNSRGPEIVIEFPISTTIPFEAADEKILGTTIVIEGIGAHDQTVPLEPSSSFSIPPPPQP